MACTNRDQVSAKLYALRNEALRRQLNLTGKSKHHRRSPTLDQGPSLPPSLYLSEELSFGTETTTTRINFPSTKNTSKLSGPPPPRSWVASPGEPNPTDPIHPEWRSTALSFIFHRLSKLHHNLAHSNSNSAALPSDTTAVPSLFRTCLQAILTDFGGIPSDMYRHIPRHILLEYVRHSAIHQSLSKKDLLEIWSLDGMNAVDGELLVTGDITTSALTLSQRASSSDVVVEDWEADNGSSCGDCHYDGKQNAPIPMHAFIALSAAFNSFHISLLPTSITYLALLNIPKIPLHCLPHQLPLLVALDLSYNQWINVVHALCVNWSAWEDLEAVALCGCEIFGDDIKHVSEEIRKGRLLDIEISIGP